MDNFDLSKWESGHPTGRNILEIPRKDGENSELPFPNDIFLIPNVNLFWKML